MAGTAESWKTTNIALNFGRLWRNCAVPGAGARPTLHTDGTPESVANPSAVHMGATTEGVEFKVNSSVEKYPVDEFPSPIITSVNSVEMGITGNLVGVTDMQLMAYLLPGVGTRATSTGYDYITVGTKAIAYDCILDTYQLIEDTSKYGWFMLYNAINESGVSWAQKRKAMGSTPFAFMGLAVGSRATADSVGQIGKQI